MKRSVVFRPDGKISTSRGLAGSSSNAERRAYGACPSRCFLSIIFQRVTMMALTLIVMMALLYPATSFILPATRRGPYPTSASSTSLRATKDLIEKPKFLVEKLGNQPTWGLFKKKEEVALVDIISIVGRFTKREDFYEGVGYPRTMGGDFTLLTKESFFEKISKKKFVRWPLDTEGRLVGYDKFLGNEKEFEKLVQQVKSSPASMVRV